MQEQIWNRVFQFSPPRGGRRRALHRPGGGATISILAPAWGRPRLPVMPGISPSYFNSRPRVGGVAALSISGNFYFQFQFSPPRGGRRPASAPRAAPVSYFNSRPRVGGVNRLGAIPVRVGISILAPAWGASTTRNYTLDGIIISILAPAWGASTVPWSFVFPRANFNSRPAWGASMTLHTARTAERNFNSRPRVGGVPARRRAHGDSRDFNSRPRVGGVHGICKPQRPRPYFNSRPRVGGVHGICKPQRPRPYFNSRPRVGGVLPFLCLSGREPISILAPAWGASMIVVKGRRGYIFQFSPPRGGRPVCTGRALHPILFQFSPPRGGRLAAELQARLAQRISILAPAWGASRC